MPATTFRACSFWMLYQYFFDIWNLVLEWKSEFVPSTRKHFICTIYSAKPRAASRSKPVQYSWPTLYQEFPFISTNGSTRLTSLFPFLSCHFPPPLSVLIEKGPPDRLLRWGSYNWRGSHFLPLFANGRRLRRPPKAFDGIRRTHSCIHTATHPHTSCMASVSLWKRGPWLWPDSWWVLVQAQLIVGSYSM